MSAVVRKERAVRLEGCHRSCIVHVLLFNLLSPPSRKIRVLSHGMFQLPNRILGKRWFWFLCQLRPKVSEVSQLFACEHTDESQVLEAGAGFWGLVK